MESNIDDQQSQGLKQPAIIQREICSVTYGGSKMGENVAASVILRFALSPVVTFQEDQTRMTNQKMGRIMASINNLVISPIHRQGFAHHAHARGVFNAVPDRAVALHFGL